MIKINFEETFDPIEIASDLSVMLFSSPQTAGPSVPIKVEIEAHPDPLLPNVFNIAFGPFNELGVIDDTAKLKHTDINKVFSTVLFLALSFLQSNPEYTIGLDGSNDSRAYLYHWMFQTNRQQLSEFFVSIGVDWYVRLLRDNEVELDEDGSPFFKPRPELFDFDRPRLDLYRYYMFHLKK